MPDLYQLSDEGRARVDAARGIANNVALPAAAEVDEQARFPQEAIDALAAGGFFGLCLPPEVNGAGHPPRVFAAVVEELAQACPSTAMIYVMHVSAAAAIATSETLTGRIELLESIAKGEQLATLAFSEKGSRSQFWAPVSRLERNGDGFCTTAKKSWVTSASRADVFVCSAQQPGAASPMESTLYLVRKGANGVSIEGAFNGLGLRGNDSAPMAFDRLAVSEGDLLSAQGSGVAMMLEVVLPWFVVGTSAMANGICRAAVNATAKHVAATRFEHDGMHLRDLPNLRARIAEMSLRTEQSTALLAATTRMMEAPDETTPLFVLQSRLSALQAAVDVTDLAMKACGGAAFSKHLALERYFRDARAGWVMAPTVDHLRDFIGRALTGLPLF
jgi:alkylation response protein AidB-like acyl-CoA dehydrogenase